MNTSSVEVVEPSFVCRICNKSLEGSEAYLYAKRGALSKYSVCLPCKLNLLRRNKRPMIFKRTKHGATPEAFYERIELILKRLSRTKLIPPWEVERICHLWADKWNCNHHSTIRALTDRIFCPPWPLNNFFGKLGYVCGEVIGPKQDDTTVERLYWRCFWAEMKKANLSGAQPEIALLLFMLGDKDAVKHSKSRNSGNLWGRKKAHS